MARKKRTGNGDISAEKVVSAQSIEIHGDLNFGSVSTPIDELIAVLDLRAEALISMLDSENEQAIGSIQRGRGYQGVKGKKGVEETRKELNAIRLLFIDLHMRNKEALRSGQFLLSHELTMRIHELLWIRARNVFWDAHADPGAQYCVHFEPAESYFENYPGEIPSSIVTALPKDLSAKLQPPKLMEYGWETERRVMDELETQIKAIIQKRQRRRRGGGEKGTS